MTRRAKNGDAKGLARVHVDSWKTTYTGIVPETYLQDLSYDNREKMWERGIDQGSERSSIFVAENTYGDIIGFASGGPERTKKYGYDGELYAIYLLKEYQGQQIGKQLVQMVANDLVEKGFQSVLVWVLADNPSRKFYESLQAEEVGKKEIEIGGEMFEEIAYGWIEIEALLGKIKR
ncbi:GNAT family N-acetyltransferase [Fredinandcohnia sp. SECRCQ15]|uniref:GNAT family N-acetyltransferase n=2 Tax=Fredinandcohnia quinoae TaxID=2918902 RepID=A0AAW5EF34_9BACI|nr:GNAT family N-acetyltransferase [Fredinandcohnia sp. SECRCQ15]MCH1627798.1 GNAT family N-acetyltransferase [Fredinandcohnia sp. SECRCQ15]